MKVPSKIDVVMVVLVLVIVGLVVLLFWMSSGLKAKTESVPSKQLVDCRNSVYGQYSSGQNLAELSALSACQKMYGSN